MRYVVTTKRRFIGSIIMVIIMLCCIWFVLSSAVSLVAAQVDRSLPIYSVEVEQDKKLIAMGINCAWDNDDIEEYIKVLDEYDAKATFFVVGDWVDRYPESLKLLSTNGHEIGNHSDTHKDFTKLSRDEIAGELSRASAKIKRTTDQTVDLVRVPSGAYNNLAIDTARGMGYEVIQWNIDSLDWKGLSAKEIYDRVVGRANSGAITLFHSGKPNMITALPEILKTLKAEGYSFVTVSEMIYKDNFIIDEQGRQRPSVDNGN